MALQPICINATSQCGSGSPLPPCVGNCGGGSGGDCNCWTPWDIESGYSAGDVVIYNDQLYTANADIPPGTPFVIGTTGQTWRAISVGVTTIPPFADDRAYTQYEAVSYDGKLYTANTSLLPGPFNPVDWTEISSDGVISTENSESVALSGNGTALDPLIAELILASGDNLLEVTPDGLYLDPANIPASETIVDTSEGVTWYVDAVKGVDTNTGLLTSPFRTVTHAMVQASGGDLIKVFPGTYPNENVIWKNNVLIEGYAAQDSSITILQGQFSVGLGITRARAKDIQLRGNVAGVPTLTFNGSDGRHYFDNVTINHTGAVDTVRFTGNNQRWYVFRGGSIAGNVDITNPAQANAITVYIENGAEATDIEMTPDNVSVYVTNRIALGEITHAGGQLYIQNVKSIESLISSADLPGALVVSSSSMLQTNGAFGTLDKTGDAPFWFNAFARDPDADESGFTGLKTLIEIADDIDAQHFPVNYSSDTRSVADHLVGIDNALANIALGKTVAVDFGVDFGDQWVTGEVAISHVLRVETSFELPDVSSVVFSSSDPLNGIVRVVVVPFDGSPNYDLITVDIQLGIIANLSGVAATLAVNDTLLFVTDNPATFSYAALTITGYRVIDYT